MKFDANRRTQLILGVAGILLLASLGGPAVSGRDDKPVAPVSKNQDEKAVPPAEAKKLDEKVAPPPRAKKKDAKTDEPGEAAKQDKKAAVVPAVRIQPANPQAVEDQFEAQFLPQFRQLYKAELRFMRLAAQPTKQQYELVAAEGEPALKVALRAYAKRFRGGPVSSTNPNQTMADAINQAAKKHLTPQQAACYQKELDARTKAFRRMAVDNLVVMVDKALYLSADQRLKLIEVLDNNWDDSWCQMQYFWNEGRWFPAMPDKKISPILTESQRSVWNGIQKNNVNFGIAFSVGEDNLDEETWPEDSPKKGASLDLAPLPREKTPNKGGGGP